MIELIFALVIMGITLLSAPLLISQASNTNTVAFQQESIAIIASHTNAILTYAWDEQNTESRINFENRILRVNDGNVALSESNRTLPGIRQFDPDPLAVATTTLGIDTNLTTVEIVNDDVDDFITNVITVNPATTDATSTNDGDYIDTTIQLTTQVAYMEEKNVAFTTNSLVYNIPKAAQVATSNVKYITTSLTSNLAGIDKDIRLKAFMCNIGAAQPQSSKDLASELQNTTITGLF